MPRFHLRPLAGAVCALIAAAPSLSGAADLPMADGSAAPLVPAVREAGRDVYLLTYEGGAPAMVALAPRGGAELALVVVDPRGRTLCSTRPGTGEQRCRWKPARTEEYRVEVRSRGAEDVEYLLWTN